MAPRLTGIYAPQPRQNAKVKAHNRALVLYALLTHPHISRQEIARLTMLAPSTVSNITGELIEQGLARRAGSIGATGAGRKSELLTRSASARRVAAVHLTPERCVAAVLDLGYALLVSEDIVFDDGFEESDIPDMLEAADRLVEKAGGRERVSGVCLACPNHPYNLSRIDREFSGHFDGLPFFRMNNTEAMAVYEYYLKLDKLYRTVAYVYVGSGVGSGLIIDGSLYRGVNGNACDLGHMYMTDRPFVCRCGRQGCMETVASERAISREIVSRYELERPPVREGLIRMLADGLRSGDARCEEIVGEAADYLGKGLFNLVSITDPQIVLVAGRLNSLNPYYSSLVEESYMKRARSSPSAIVPLEFVPVRNESALVGAAMFSFISTLCDVA